MTNNKYAAQIKKYEKEAINTLRHIMKIPLMCLYMNSLIAFKSHISWAKRSGSFQQIYPNNIAVIPSIIITIYSIRFSQSYNNSGLSNSSNDTASLSRPHTTPLSFLQRNNI
jgi:hypothetical protein